MPFYQYECKKCGKPVEVMRSLNEFDKGPESEDIKDLEEVKCTHDWERVIGGVKTIKGASWGGGKGNWNSNDW